MGIASKIEIQIMKTEAYLGPSKSSVMALFATIVN